ncbi:MAG: hypothetical protein L3K52_00910 [Candidatus Thiothrix sulfatifontis]|nr:MAG: hypothetical protein L3K52_00910 [Candidatus Thiothrix sulfatifontis]
MMTITRTLLFALLCSSLLSAGASADVTTRSIGAPHPTNPRPENCSQNGANPAACGAAAVLVSEPALVLAVVASTETEMVSTLVPTR